jgi:glycosyltransferase involved in cell wall biosynthesis
VSNGVEFRGWMDYEDALTYLARCDVGLVPHHVTESWQTTIPNKLFDYMSIGKPVLVSNARPAERIVREEGCGLVFPDRDAGALAEAIVALADPAVREACGQRGRDAIRRRYHWEADERRLLAAISNTVGLRPSRGAAPVPAPGSAPVLPHGRGR